MLKISFKNSKKYLKPYLLIINLAFKNLSLIIFSNTISIRITNISSFDIKPIHKILSRKKISEILT